jgi:magnesium transporter
MTGPPRANRDSAHWHLTRLVPTAKPDDTAEQMLAALRGRRFDCPDPIVVVDTQQRVLGQIPLGHLLAVEPGRTARELMRRDAPSVGLRTDQERVASVALQHALTAVTVVDDDQRFAGVVPPQILLAILRREHVEDLHRLAGITHDESQVREAMEAPPVRRARHRVPWLIAGLAGSIVAALIMARFEALLAANLAIAFFVPGIVYLADAIGTQTEAITVRGLSLAHAPIGRLIAAEVRTGLLIGSLLGALAVGGVWLALRDPRLALAAGLSLFAASAIATSIGMVLPWVLHRLGSDPAYGSGPLATIIQDVVSVAVYLLVTSALVA